MPVEAAAPQAEAPAGAEVALQEASEANGSSDAPGRSRPVYSPDEILEQLQSAPQPHCFNHQMLLKAHELQLQVVHGLKNAEARGPDAAHRILAAYVQVRGTCNRACNYCSCKRKHYHTQSIA